MKDKDLISIIIPTYNRKLMLKDAVNSILKQNYSDFEIIIIDDCSEDDTKEIVSSYNSDKIHYYRNEKNSGAGITRKNGYNKCKGKYLVFMDDDDYYLDSAFFSKSIEIFRNNKNVSFVSENSLIHYEDTNKYEFEPLNIKGMIRGIDYLKGFQTKFMKPNSTFPTMFRKEILEKVGNIEMLNDSSIYMYALLYGDAFILEDIVGVYRIHKTNITFNLKLDFLLANLDEKKNVYNKLKNILNLEEAKEWWHNQIDITLKYYLSNTKISKKQLFILLDWCKKNGEDINMDYL